LFFLLEHSTKPGRNFVVISTQHLVATMMPQPLEHIMTGGVGGGLGGGGGEEAEGLDGRAMVLNVVDTKQQMHDSEMTPPTDPGSVSEDETTTGVMSSFGAGTWLGGIGNDFRNLATSIKDTLPPTIGGIANFVHQSAMIIAAEIAQMDEEHYQSSNSVPTTTSSTTSGRDGDRNLQSNRSSSEDAYLHLPWEVVRYDTLGPGGGFLHAEHQQNEQDPDSDSVPVYMTDEELIQIILSLSLKESTFLGPYSPSHLEDDEEDEDNNINEEGASRNISPRFALDEPRIHLIRRLLDIDGNLAKIHARLSGEYSFGRFFRFSCFGFLVVPHDVRFWRIWKGWLLD
jgi:hypothetical protein